MKALHCSWECCHLGCRPVQEYLPKCSTSITLCLVVPPGEIVRVSGWLADISMDMPRICRANIVTQVPVQPMVGYNPRYIKVNSISGCHLSEDRAGYSLLPSDKKVTYWLSTAEGLTAQQLPILVPCHWSQVGEMLQIVPINLKSWVTILWWTMKDILRNVVPVGSMDVEYTETRIGVLTNWTTGYCI